MNGDSRILLARPDLVATDLQGLVRGERFAKPEPRRLIGPFAAIRSAPAPGAEQVDQLLFGEVFDVLDVGGAFSWGQARRSGYVGFVESAPFSTDQGEPTHWVSARSTFAFEEPSVRAAPFGPLSMNVLVAVEAEASGFSKARGAGWIPTIHLSSIGLFHDDPAAAAERLIGAPYLWGGRQAGGLDCSGLVQQALFACGRACPRDADQQVRLGVPAPPDQLRRADLVFWRGHVGMMLDAERLLHANAHHMAVAMEPLAEAVVRITAAGGGEPTHYRRLQPG